MSTASHVRQRTTVPSPGRFTASSATWLAVSHPGAQSRGRSHLGAEHLGQQGADRVAVDDPGADLTRGWSVGADRHDLVSGRADARRTGPLGLRRGRPGELPGCLPGLTPGLKSLASSLRQLPGRGQ